MHYRDNDELIQALTEQWQQGMVSGRECIALTLQEIQADAPDAVLSISDVIKVVEACQFPFESTSKH